MKDRPGFIRLLDEFVALCRLEAAQGEHIRAPGEDGFNPPLPKVTRHSQEHSAHLQREARRAEDRMVDMLCDEDTPPHT